MKFSFTLAYLDLGLYIVLYKNEFFPGANIMVFYKL